MKNQLKRDQQEGNYQQKKKKNSNSWFMNLKILLLKYNLDDPLDLLDNPKKKGRMEIKCN